MKKLEKLEPKRVFYYFEKLCSIPHGSGNTKAISDYCVDVARSLNLDVTQDKMNNVIIRKGATKGKEDKPIVVLQGHLDMVCEKTADSCIDFLKDGLDIYIEDGFIKARGTTLGGDDGIAVAMALAILEAKDIEHPALEVLFTVDEETGMYGAEALDGSLINGRTFINIDCEEEGVFTVSCAGGIGAEITLPFETAVNCKPCYKITADGLMGGHSGVDIDKGRINSNKLIAKLLNNLENFNLVSINGGLKANAIPTLTEAVIATDEDLQVFLKDFEENNKVPTDNNLKISTVPVEIQKKAMTDASTKKVIAFLNEIPNGIISMSKDIEGLVETSLNLGILKTNEDRLYLNFALRSSVNNDKYKLLDTLKEYSKKYGAELVSDGDYPAWEYRKDSPLRDTMCRVYKDMYKKEPEVVAIHAGLECGLLSKKLAGLDAVSIGPDMFDIHTPRERVSIDSTKRTYEFLLQLLKEI